MTEPTTSPESGLRGSFHKGPDHFYTAISPLCARLFGAPEGYHADMRWDDFTSDALRTDPGKYLREDTTIIENNLGIHCDALVRGVDGEWMRLYLHKSRSADGGIAGQVTLLPLRSMYNGWIVKLDHTRQVLPLPNGAELTRDDLRLLHGVLHGIPRKLIARSVGLSVKAIEKRLRRVRDKLEHPHCACYSVHGCVNWYGLSEMILDRYDWFDMMPSYRSYPGTMCQSPAQLASRKPVDCSCDVGRA